MSEFARSMRKLVIRDLAPTPYKANPLIILGLSPVILDLGLKDEEIYEILYRYSRSILAKFHEDVAGKTPAMVERQRQFAAIFDQMKDRRIFTLALQELKDARNVVHSSLNEQIRIIASKDEALERAKDEITTIFAQNEATKRLLEETTGIADRFVRSHSAYIRRRFSKQSTISGTISPEEASTVYLMSFRFVSERSLPRANVIPSLKDKYGELLERHRQQWRMNQLERKILYRDWKQFFITLNENHIGVIGASDLFREALRDKNTLAPTIFWTEQKGFVRYGFNPKRGTSPGPVKIIRDMNKTVTCSILYREKDKTVREIVRHAYNRALRLLRPAITDESPFVSSIDIRLRKIKVVRGRLFWQGRSLYRIMGSLFLEDWTGDLETLSSIQPSVVLPSLYPFLIPGTLLIKQFVKEERLSTDAKRQDLKRITLKPPSTTLNASDIILFVQ